MVCYDCGGVYFLYVFNTKYSHLIKDKENVQTCGVSKVKKAKNWSVTSEGLKSQWKIYQSYLMISSLWVIYFFNVFFKNIYLWMIFIN